MDAGMGMAMGNMMGNAMTGGGAPPQAPTAASPPPPPTNTLHYNGPDGQGQFSPADIAQKIAANRTGSHSLWAQGWSGWKPWNQVPAVANLVPPETASPPPPPGGENFHYTGADGQSLQLSAGEVAEKVQSDPGGKHLIWKKGFDGWKSAGDVPAIQGLMNAGPPPIPDGGPPPPPVD